MKVTLIGTGCPVADPHRGGAATLIQSGESAVLVDCGSGVAQGLVSAGCPGAKLDAVLITHLHSDHLVDFYNLVVSSWHQGRMTPWLVYAPEPAIAVIEATMAAWADERALRVEWEARADAIGLDVHCLPLAPGRELFVGDLAIEPVLVDHAPVEPAYGFVFRDGLKSAVVSGDTCRCPRLEAAGQGTDLLVHEVFIHAAMSGTSGTRTSTTLERVAQYHTAASEVGKVAAVMGARALALTHLVPPDADRAALLAEVGRDFSGPLFVGEDGMSFDLATGDVAFGALRARMLA